MIETLSARITFLCLSLLCVNRFCLINDPLVCHCIQIYFMPKLEGDNVIASAQLPIGAPVEETEKVKRNLMRTLDKVLERHGGRDRFH